MAEIRTEDCLVAIKEHFLKLVGPYSGVAGNWKRLSKIGNAKDGFLRIFTADSLPHLVVFVYSTEAEITEVKIFTQLPAYMKPSLKINELPRHFVPNMTHEELAQKILIAVEQDEFLKDRITQSYKFNFGEFLDKTPDDLTPVQKVLVMNYLTGLTPQVEEDLCVRFDLENNSITEIFSRVSNAEGAKVMGFQTLSNGLTFVGCNAGGDWESPVFYLIYWDGEQLRAYVPTEGNPFNSDTNEAYGNDDESDLENLAKRYPGARSTDDVLIEPQKILADISANFIAKD